MKHLDFIGWLKWLKSIKEKGQKSVKIGCRTHFSFKVKILSKNKLKIDTYVNVFKTLILKFV